MSHPDLIIAAKLAPEEPIVQLGRFALLALRTGESHPEPYIYRVYQEAVRLGLIKE